MNPITDIQFLEATDPQTTPACPENYTYAAFVQWNGIFAGCNCKSSVLDVFPDIDRGECSAN